MATSDAIKNVKQQASKGSEFVNKITADGSSGFKAERGRYHLYAAMACPFTHRALMVRKVKGLEDVVTVTVTDFIQDGPKGWKFTDERPGCSLDNINGKTHLSEIYEMASPGYSGRVSVPVLWDTKQKTILSNDSMMIMRMFNSEFNEFCSSNEQREINLYPEFLQSAIEEAHTWIGVKINRGVYMAGFAKSQEDYDASVNTLFEALDQAEAILSKQRYVVGHQVTEIDLCLFATLIRFDWVYHGHFKCNKKRILDYPSLWGFTRDIYNFMGIGETVNRLHITSTYYGGHKFINPTGIIPVGPDLDFSEPHGREKLQ